MIKRNRILAGTAIGLLMATTPLMASPLSNSLSGDTGSIASRPLILAQAQEEEPRRQRREGQQDPAARQAPAEAPQAAPERQAEPEPQAAPERQAAPEQQAEPRQRAEPKQRAQPEPAPRAQEEQAEPTPRAQEQREERRQGEGEGAREQKKQADQTERQQRRQERAQREQAEPAGKPEAAEEAPSRKQQRQADEQREQKKAPTEEQAAPAQEAEEQAKPADEAAPAKEPTRAERQRERRDSDAAEERAGERGAGEEADTAGEEAERPRLGGTSDAQRGTGGEQAPDEEGGRNEDKRQRAGEEQQPEGAAPVLDSQKEQKRPAGQGEAREGRDRDRGDRAERRERREERREERRQAREDAGPPPDSDRAAQQRIHIENMQSVTAEEGRRVRDGERRRPERREGARVLEEIGDRFVVEFNNTTIVQSPDRERVRWNSREYYYDELPGDRTREVVVRENGVQVVTIRNRYGDIIRRSRIAPDGHEYVLVYAGERENWNEWHDPAADLPPLVLTIPVEEYILESEPAVSSDDYYTFLDQPPVEPVERLYTVDEVKYSARIRDTVRRVDLDTITFEFGSDEIAESEIGTLEDVAVAMERLIEENPGETFLIEGHTDAVGSDTANLALSDSRAEAVAEALTNVFAIPPENMFTQGYGEQYLKIDTEEPDRENRRVAIRRITPLVQPVASAE